MLSGASPGAPAGENLHPEKGKTASISRRVWHQIISTDGSAACFPSFSVRPYQHLCTARCVRTQAVFLSAALTRYFSDKLELNRVNFSARDSSHRRSDSTHFSQFHHRRTSPVSLRTLQTEFMKHFTKSSKTFGKRRGHWRPMEMESSLDVSVFLCLSCVIVTWAHSLC